MRRLTHSLAIGWLVIWLPSCPGKDARRYAERLAGLLDVYRQEVNKKIEDETHRYERAARTYAEERREDALDHLTSDRRDAAVQFSNQLAAGQADGARVLDAVRRYGATDFETTSKIYQAPSDDYLQHIASLEELKFEQARIDRLQKLLSDLAKKPDLASLAGELAAFGKEFQGELAHAQCLQAVDRLTTHEAKKKALEKEIAGLPAGAPGRKEKEAELESLKGDIKALEAARDAGGRFKNGACAK